MKDFSPVRDPLRKFEDLNWSLCLINYALCRDSVVGIATGYGLDDREVGVRIPVGSGILSSSICPDWFWGPPNILSNGYQDLFPRG
jgi:hypothetical protein